MRLDVGNLPLHGGSGTCSHGLNEHAASGGAPAITAHHPSHPEQPPDGPPFGLLEGATQPRHPEARRLTTTGQPTPRDLMLTRPAA